MQYSMTLLSDQTIGFNLFSNVEDCMMGKMSQRLYTEEYVSKTSVCLLQDANHQQASRTEKVSLQYIQVTSLLLAVNLKGEMK